MPERIDVHVHVAGLAELAQLVATGFKELKQEIKTMGTTLADQLTAQQAETSAALDGISTTVSSIATDVTEIGADVDQLLAGAQPGVTLTQAMVDTMGAIRDRAVAAGAALAAAKDGLDAVNAKVPPAAP